MNAIAITDHAKDRYAEKIMGITEHNTRKQYLAMNDKKIVADITKLITYAELIYTGQLGGDKKTRDYYINGNVGLVVKNDAMQDSRVIVTLYDINFQYPDSLKKTVISELKQAILLKEADITEFEEALADLKDELGNTNLKLDAEIGKHQAKINTLKLRKANNESELKEAQSKLYEIQAEQKAYAYQLFANNDSKGDI